MPINADHYWIRGCLIGIDLHWFTMIDIDPHRSALIGIYQHWSALLSVWIDLDADQTASDPAMISIDRHWSTLIFIESNWSFLIFIDRQWSILNHILDQFLKFDFYWSTLIGIGDWSSMSWNSEPVLNYYSNTDCNLSMHILKWGYYSMVSAWLCLYR